MMSAFNALLNSIIGLSIGAAVLVIVVPLATFALVKLMTRKPDDFTGDQL